MNVTQISTPGLGDRSYVIDDGSIAVVVDPQRDVDRIHAVLADRGVRAALIVETHVHNDYVSGGLSLARTTGADYAINAADDVSFDRRPVEDGEEITVGGLTVRAMATPGHTPTHLSYLIAGGGEPGAVFTGGSMLYGTVGRTDLIADELTDRLTREQHRSVRHLAESLAAETAVHPTHGFGSFCSSAGGAERTSGTVADERRENIAVTTDDEDEFVRELLDGFTAQPPYYAHMGLLNRAGPQPVDLSSPSRATPEQLAERIARGEWVIDVRPRRDFADDHLSGTISVEGGDSFATYVAWSIPWGTPVTLVGDDDEQIAEAQRELVRVGIDRPQAMATGGPGSFADGQARSSYRRAAFADLADAPDAFVLDVRRQDEWDDGHLQGATHAPLESLTGEVDRLPTDQPIWVHCASGFRASIASSLVARSGRQVVHIDDEFDNAEESGRPVGEDDT